MLRNKARTLQTDSKQKQEIFTNMKMRMELLS